MAEPVRVLFIGGNAVDEEVHAALEKAGFQVESRHAKNAEELAAELDRKWGELAFAIFSPRGLSPIDALAAIHEREIDLPVIVVSRSAKESDVTPILKAGAADYLTRGSLTRLSAAVERELRAARLRKERTGLEEQFRHAQKMEAVGRLAGGVAHDFNNLLTVITGYSDLLLSGTDLKPGHRSALEEIRRAAERGGALTHQLLAFSRRQPMQVKPVGIHDLIMHLQKMLRRLIGEDISLLILPAAGRDTVVADPGRLEQVLMNVVVNARDAMPGGGTLTVETANEELDEPYSAKQLGVKNGPFLVLSITDTGHGMDRETRSHLFEPFFSTKGPRGTGLGLATAYGIVRQTGGAITVLSESGQGTMVKIYLPLADPDQAKPVEATKDALALRGAETILLVEDEARVRKLIGDVLTARGYTVIEATRGDEAVRLAGSYSERMDLLLVDVVMPGMSGPEVARQVQELRDDIRVLFISGYTDEVIVHHGIPESGAAFLPKPFLPDGLARKVREVLDARAGSSKTQQPGE